MFKRILLIGCLLFPCLILAQDDSITLSNIKFCYYLWGSAMICEQKSAGITENERIQFRELCDRLVRKKYGLLSDSIAQMMGKSIYDGASDTLASEGRCNITKAMIVNLLTNSNMKE